MNRLRAFLTRHYTLSNGLILLAFFSGLAVLMIMFLWFGEPLYGTFGCDAESGSAACSVSNAPGP